MQFTRNGAFTNKHIIQLHFASAFVIFQKFLQVLEIMPVIHRLKHKLNKAINLFEMKQEI